MMSLSADHGQHKVLRKTQNQSHERDPPHQKIKSPTIEHDGPKYFTTHMHSDGQRTMVNTRILSESVTVQSSLVRKPRVSQQEIQAEPRQQEQMHP